jgi:hypothetical protein
VFQGDWTLDSQAHPFGWEDALIELLQSTIEPDSWDEVGGPGSIAAARGLLVVSQTHDVHRKITATLSGLRQVRDAQRAKPGGEPIVIGQTAEDIAAHKRFRTGMAQKVTFKFNETPLNEIVDYLRTNTKLTILLDAKSLDEIGIPTDAPITFRAVDVPLELALREMFKSLDPTLTYEHWHESLMITTRDSGCGYLSNWLYPVGDLIGNGADEGTAFDYDTLIELIQTTVEPDAWDEVGGPGQIAEYEQCQALIVTQDPRIHAQISQLLSRLRKIVQARQKAKPKADSSAKVQTTEADPYLIAIYQINPSKNQSDEANKALVEIVQELVAPESWNSQETTARALPGRLIVRQRLSVQRKIYELLSELDELQSGFETPASSPSAPRDETDDPSLSDFNN